MFQLKMILVPFEDDFPTENGDIPASYVSLPKGSWQKMFMIWF